MDGDISCVWGVTKGTNDAAMSDTSLGPTKIKILNAVLRAIDVTVYCESPFIKSHYVLYYY